jgi:hypothetical protein
MPVNGQSSRPLELVVALAVLVMEYLAVLPGYVSTFYAKASLGAVTGPLLYAFLNFLVLRPLVLYLLWRGTSWVRTWIIWTLPITLAAIFIKSLGTQTSNNGVSSPTIWDAYDTLTGGNLITMIALCFGLLAFMALYSPRVGAWFRHMKQTRSKGSDAGI